MELPIEKKLSDNVQIEMARLQDACMEAVYSLDQNAVLHGGTAIWRCYGGNRFSDDIDLYIRTDKEIAAIRNNLVFALNKYDITIAKTTTIERSSIFTIRKDAVQIKLEAGKNRNRLLPIEKNYEKANGTYMSILTLSPENFIFEKIEAYKSRRYVRDLYDIYHLANIARKGTRLSSAVCEFLDGAEKPVDESNLTSIVYSGATPSFEGMVNSIKGHFCEVHR